MRDDGSRLLPVTLKKFKRQKISTKERDAQLFCVLDKFNRTHTERKTKAQMFLLSLRHFLHLKMADVNIDLRK